MGRGEVSARGKQGRIAVPAMPRPMAILCCVLNFLVPGLGRSYLSLYTEPNVNILFHVPIFSAVEKNVVQILPKLKIKFTRMNDS